MDVVDPFWIALESWHYGKMVYRKSELVDGLHVLVYFCEEPDFVGWWIAPSLGDSKSDPIAIP